MGNRYNIWKLNGGRFDSDSCNPSSEFMMRAQNGCGLRENDAAEDHRLQNTEGEGCRAMYACVI